MCRSVASAAVPDHRSLRSAPGSAPDVPDDCRPRRSSTPRSQLRGAGAPRAARRASSGGSVTSIATWNSISTRACGAPRRRSARRSAATPPRARSRRGSGVFVGGDEQRRRVEDLEAGPARPRRSATRPSCRRAATPARRRGGSCGRRARRPSRGRTARACAGRSTSTETPSPASSSAASTARWRISWRRDDASRPRPARTTSAPARAARPRAVGRARPSC